MKLNKTLLLILILISSGLFAQGEKMREKREHIKNLKIAFITNELDLTSDEAEKFWPIYNTFDDKQFELRHQKMKSYIRRMDDESLDKMSEKEAAVFLVQIENTEEELYQLRRKLTYNLKGIINPIKIVKLKRAEEDFNRKLLQQYKNKPIKQQ